MHIKIWFEHGAFPTNYMYSNIMIPGAKKVKLRALGNQNPFQNVANIHAKQAIDASDFSVARAVFYQAGKVELFNKTEVGEPFLMMIKKAERGLRLSVSDPTQKLQQRHFRLEGTYSTQNQDIILKNGQFD